MQQLISKLTGYKATNGDMTCRGHRFELGVWYEVDGDLSLCHHGFHFCDHPSGVWEYYSGTNTRVFTCEAEDVLDLPVEPGATHKRVARRIRLVAEVKIGGIENTGDCNTGNYNTGNYNTGNRNTGYYNTGYCNTGDCNTGYYNTGNYNTGDCNTGDCNTGNYNTGDCNTGYCNTGDCNTGDCNTGDCNTGDCNTGIRNTGYCNTTNRHTGLFCTEEPKVLCFDSQTDLTYDEFCDKYPNYYLLGEAICANDTINFEQFKEIPGITPEKLLALHEKHKAARSSKIAS